VALPCCSCHVRACCGCTFQSPPNSCRTPQDSAGLQAKVLILVASPAKLGRVGQSLEELGRT